MMGGGARWNDMLLMKTASLGLLEVMVVRVNESLVLIFRQLRSVEPSSHTNAR